MRAKLFPCRGVTIRLLVAALAVSLTLSTAAQSPTGAAGQPRTGGSSQLPVMGDGGDMGASEERRLGDRIVREIFRDPDYIDDPVVAEYVDGIWQPLLAAARARGDLSGELEQRFAWQVLMGRDRSVNAFALPGGYLGLHMGLVAVVGSRDELASVLAHELSHVTQRHIARLTSKQNAQTPWVIGAMILGALAASKSPDAANALFTGGQAVAMQNQLNFSRDMEREADRIGFAVMGQAGFDTEGFASMFDKLQAASRLNDNGAFPYLRSHPLTSERIADVRGRLPVGAARGAAQQGGSLEHAMVSARARVIANSGIDALRKTVAQAAADAGPSPDSAARRAGALYAASLAAAWMRDHDAAQRLHAQLEPLVRAEPAAQRLAQLLAVELATLAGRKAPDVAAQGRAALLLVAQARIREGEAAQVVPPLQSWVALHPRDASAWQMLSRASASAGQPLRAVRADAEAQVALFDYTAAMDRLKAAQAMVRAAPAGTKIDHIEASIIDTRTRQVQALLREQALER